MRPLAVLATLAALAALAAGCDDARVTVAPEGPGRYAVYTLDPGGCVVGYLCDGYTVRRGALTGTVGEVLAQGEGEEALRIGARVTWTRWCAVDLWTGDVRHR